MAPVVEIADDGAINVHGAEPQEDLSLVELLPIQGFLGVDPGAGARARTQMKTIWDYFSQDAQGTGDALFRIKQAEMKMASPGLGESRLSKLYNYVKLQSQSKDIQTQLDAL